jgi:hypothetical protein
MDPSAQDVWSADYAGVWHLTGSSFSDATTNNNDGTNNGSANATGRSAAAEILMALTIK